MTFKQKKDLLNLIDEYQWHEDNLYVFIMYYELPDFMKFFENYNTLFDDDGVDVVWRGNYMCIPNFQEVLDYIGIEEEEIKAMFDNEQ